MSWRFWFVVVLLAAGPWLSGSLAEAGASVQVDGVDEVDGVDVDDSTAGRLAGLALACVHQEYPNKIAHVMQSDADARPPRELTPSFYGCFDWHSAVHGHWLLARLARTFPEAAWAREAIFFIRVHETHGQNAGLRAYVQLSADGIEWIDEGTEFTFTLRDDVTFPIPRGRLLLARCHAGITVF